MSAVAFDETRINSRLSFKPLLTVLQKTIDEGKPASKKLYGELIQRFLETPALMEPMENESEFLEHSELVEMLLTTLFPPTSSGIDNMYGVSFPFTFRFVYASELFRKMFLHPETNAVNIPQTSIGEQLQREKIMFAYFTILKKYLGYTSPEISTSIYPFKDPVTGLMHYQELRIDGRYIEVKTLDGKDPVIPENVICPRTNHVMDIPDLLKALPLEQFVFEGVVLVQVVDVTEQHVISEIKNTLLSINDFSNTDVFQQLQGHMQSLLGFTNVKIGITPLFKVNGHIVYSEVHNSTSLLFSHFHTINDKNEVCESCETVFATFNFPVVFETLDENAIREYEHLKHYAEAGAKSLILAPLKRNNELIGILEIVSEEPGKLKNLHIRRIQDAIPLFTLALEKIAETLDTEIDRVIKQQFTAVQPTVEWKFTEAALKYIGAKQQNDNVKIGRIAFEEVYPLFAAIDIRNSSVERTQSIQLDIIEQLNSVRLLVKKAQQRIHFPLLKEIEFKIEKYIASASDVLLSEDELMIYDFLQNQVETILTHLTTTLPNMKKDIDAYYASLDPQLGMVYHHRKEYEVSIAAINDKVSKFIDREQVAAQEVFPHYFERYVTDGVEFNIYIGQSIAPRKKFDELFLRNMKMWQLTVLAKAASLTHNLEPELPHLLKTTQLILAHSIPISISFRTMERKFDVDGAYNIRYEIIKKRIDKVRVKDTNERLTQPGRIAIVYSQPKEAAEYMEFIEFLQDQGLLKPPVEMLELEELQGVSGLKALRVEVNFDEPPQVEIPATSTLRKQMAGIGA